MSNAGVAPEVGPTTRVVRVRYVVAALFGIVIGVGGILWMCNPWKLVALDRLPGVVVVLAGVALAGMASWKAASGGRVWLRRLCAALGVVGTALCALSLVLVVVARLLNPFGTDVLDERSVSISGDVSVVRRVWSTGALHACVEFEVRSGHGVWARHGSPTDCADISMTGLEDFQMSSGSEVLTVLRTDGIVCTFSVDASSLQLVAETSDGCEALSV